MRQLHAIITGHVQGVNFRMYTQQKARDLNITGWVRNRPDGTVEVLAEGEQDTLDQLHDWLHHGSPMATVDKVEATWDAAEGQFKSFEIAYYSRRGGLYT